MRTTKHGTAGISVNRNVLFIGGDAAYTIKFRAELIAKHVEQGARVVILATPISPADFDGADRLGATLMPWTLSNTGLNPLSDLRAIIQLWRAIRATKPQVVFTHMIKSVCYGLILARLCGVKLRVAMIPGLGYAFSRGGGTGRRPVRLVARCFYRLAIPHANVVIFQNNDDLETFTRLGVLSRKTKSGVVGGSGVDLEKFPQVPLSKEPTTFLFLSRLLRDKGVVEFVEAARIVKRLRPSVHFLLAGGVTNNPASIAVEQLAQWKEEGVVDVLGHLANPQPAFAECHVFVLPSSYGEGLPRSALEALATGRAIITTDIPGCRETVIPGENGLIVPPHDVEALAEAMLDMADDRAKLEKMGAESRRLCERRFELNVVVKETLALMYSRDDIPPNGIDSGLDCNLT